MKTAEAKQTKQIELAQELANWGLTGPVDDAGVQITYNGQAGSLIARLTSLDETGDFAFDTPIKDPLADSFRVSGNYPWRLDEGYNTVVHLKNTTSKEVYAVVQVRYEGGDYNPDKIKLAPYQTVAVDIRRLRDTQEKDIRGGVMPPDVTSGQILWYEQTLESLIGRAEIFAVANGVASSFSCGGGGSCGQSFSSPSSLPSSATKTAGDTGVFFVPRETDRDCFGTTLGPFSVTTGLTWTSSDTSVATVDLSSGFVMCVGAGSASILAHWTATVYSCGGTGSCSTNFPNVVASGSLQVKPQITGISPSRAPQAFGAGLSVSITGKGFGGVQGNLTLTIAGTGVTGTIDRVTPQEILATFNIADNAAAGNHPVTVKVRTQTSNSMNFFVQIPSHLVFFNAPPDAPGGKGPLVTITDGDVKDLNGNVLLPHQCGVYRNLEYQVVDQDSPAQGINAGFILTESFTDYQGPASTPRDLSRNISEGNQGALGDTQYFGEPAPSCLGNDDHETLHQHFKVTLNSKDYLLSTVVSISRGRFAGTYKVDVSIITQ
jgi:hypothetical protein